MKTADEIVIYNCSRSAPTPLRKNENLLLRIMSNIYNAIIAVMFKLTAFSSSTQIL